MEKQMRKYFILLITLIVLNGIIFTLILPQLSWTLIKNNIDYEVANNITRQIRNYSLYFLNLILAYIIYLDMKKYKNLNWPILLLTVLSNFSGIIIFLINNNLNSNIKSELNDKS